jgi:putative membrane-bound dehydrogenase-like protein
MLDQSLPHGAILRFLLVAAFILPAGAASTHADDRPIPHNQDAPPGLPLTPEEARRKITVPPGFAVELVASEPDLVNPVAMTFDERGRVWVTESLEYPRKEPGPGQDRVKVMEDTDGDGKADRFTVFADGLNIPSGIAVGHGGVWVANAPDILFMQDTDGDGKADRREVVVTGYGRDDTHELPNSLVWGPDGWLYGLNGVFNPSRIDYRGKRYEFTCAMFRIHPRTRDFEVFCEGTSNPWGIAFDPEGSAFVSACVIDHLWHLTQTGYYHRQGGAYPPFTWIAGSIVDHTHQKAAYCGIHYFDGDAYPREYRDRLVMGNIHGNCINVDVLARNGSTYRGQAAPDFLTAHDAWFMPVSQKTGPDGCLYVLDWYDRYHCYQDARRDPAGIDRGKGRLYRIRYKDTPRRAPRDLGALDAQGLVQTLSSENGYDRDMAVRLLAERAPAEARAPLEEMVLAGDGPRKGRMSALWALVGMGPLESDFHLALLDHGDPGFRAWGVRAAGNAKRVAPGVRDRLAALAADPSPDVRLQAAIAARRVEGIDPLPMLDSVLARSADDPLIPLIVWQNLLPLIPDRLDDLLAALADGPPSSAGLALLAPRLVDRLVGQPSIGPEPVVALLESVTGGTSPDDSRSAECLRRVAKAVQDRELGPEGSVQLKAAMQPLIEGLLAGTTDRATTREAALLAASWRMPSGYAVARRLLSDAAVPADQRTTAFDALAAAGDRGLVDAVAAILDHPESAPAEWRGNLIASLGKIDDPRVAPMLLDRWAALEGELRPRVVEVLTQRVSWARTLMDAIGDRRLPPETLNANQVRKLLASGDEELAALVRKHWGTVRDERNPEREKVIADVRRLVRSMPADPRAGAVVFKRVCGQCHKIYGEGQDVGPDVTNNGRGSFEQLLSNVLDPSLVIGKDYQAQTLVTADGRVLVGLLEEDSPNRVVLKVQGGKREVIPRSEIDELTASRLSMMPEDLEKQTTTRELVDLFGFLVLDRPPDDPQARQLAGAGPVRPRDAADPAAFDDLIAEVAPGFSCAASGELGVGIVAEHAGRPGVLRTHPVSREVPCILTRQIDVSASGTSTLLIDASHDPRGDWHLVVRVNGKTLHDGPVGPDTAPGGWLHVELDLTPLAGQAASIEIENRASDWKWEFGYWGEISIVSRASAGG